MRLLLVISSAGLLALAHASAQEAASDLKKFQGAWRLVRAEADGKKTPDEEVKKIRLTIQGNRFVLRRDDKVLSEGTFSLDDATNPKAIDETLTAGPRKGKTFLAIYEIDDVHHKICFAAAGKHRPKDLSAPAGSGRLLQLWKRADK